MQSNHRSASRRGPLQAIFHVSLRALLLLGALGWGAVGCGDASQMFGGVWRSEATLDAGWISGRPELSIGHFGPEMTGIVRFLDEDNLPTQACKCAFIDQQDVDLPNQRFVVTTTLCDDPATLLVWELTLDEEAADPRLIGEVRRANDDATPPEAVSFRLDDSFVSDDLRECVRDEP